MIEFLEYMDRIGENIRNHGWHAQGVFGDIPFLYTVGLTDMGLPEILIIGLPANVSHALITEAIEEFKTNGVPTDGQITTKIANMPSAYRVLDPTDAAKEHTCMVENYYGEPKPVIQIVWPDKSGKFPWDAGCDHKFATIQSGVINWARMN